MDNSIQTVVEIALSRWSVAVQSAVVVVFAVTFRLLARATGRRAAGLWSVAWTADAIALLAVLCVAVVSPFGERGTGRWFYLAYAVAKPVFALFLIRGVAALAETRLRPIELASQRPAVPTIAWAAALVLGAAEMVGIQLLVYLLVGCLLLGSAIELLRRGARAAVQAIAGLAALGAIFLHHFAVLVPVMWGGGVPVYMSRISFLDAVAELVVGVLCLVALARTMFDEMAVANLELEAAQRRLRELVDVDELTGLFNRRRLRSFVESLGGTDGVVVFFDIDAFKAINDRWGHAAGDRCLRRVAEAMRSEFRSCDGLFRLGGDEFLVVAPGLASAEAHDRIERLRAAAARAEEAAPGCAVSAGVSEFGDARTFDAALAAADEAMYRDKQRRSR